MIAASAPGVVHSLQECLHFALRKKAQQRTGESFQGNCHDPLGERQGRKKGVGRDGSGFTGLPIRRMLKSRLRVGACNAFAKVRGLKPATAPARVPNDGHPYPMSKFDPLSASDCALLLIDFQLNLLAKVGSMPLDHLKNNVLGLAHAEGRRSADPSLFLGRRRRQWTGLARTAFDRRGYSPLPPVHRQPVGR